MFVDKMKPKRAEFYISIDQSQICEFLAGLV